VTLNGADRLARDVAVRPGDEFPESKVSRPGFDSTFLFGGSADAGLLTSQCSRQSVHLVRGSAPVKPLPCRQEELTDCASRSLAVYSSVPVYEMMVRGIGVMRRRQDSWLNATQILKVAGVEKGKRTKILEKDIAQGVHEKVQGGYGRYQGTW
jgi:hypothetical protein